MCKIIFSLCFFFLFLFGCKANKSTVRKTTESSQDTCKYYYNPTLKKNVYTLSDEPPEFNGGMAKLNTYIMDNVRMKEQEYVQGSFNIIVTLDENGKVIDQRMTNNKKDLTEQEKEFLRVISNMPNWKPGKCKGTSICFEVPIPIRLALISTEKR